MNRYHGEKGSWAWNGEIGPLLSEARKRRGLSLKEAERSTSIRSRYLEGLERETPGELPGKGYIQSFLSSYAEFLGLDVEELSCRFKRHAVEAGQRREGRSKASEGVAREEEAARPEPPGRRALGRGTLLGALSLGLVVLALAGAAFYLLRGEAPLSWLALSEESPEQRAPKESEPDAAPQENDPAPTLEEDSISAEPGRETQIRARVTVRGAESWISVESGSGVEYTGIAQPGFSRVFESGDSLRITTGNAGAVELRLNGLDYGTLGESGEVTSRSFTLKKES